MNLIQYLKGKERHKDDVEGPNAGRWRHVHETHRSLGGSQLKYLQQLQPEEHAAGQ